MIIPALGEIQAQKCKENTSVSATQLLLALKSYKIKKGDLPRSLTDLIPEYFNQIPIDDFDGKPMRYSVKNKVIYSVGKDLVDSGGVFEAGWIGKTEDISFKIDF